MLDITAFGLVLFCLCLLYGYFPLKEFCSCSLSPPRLMLFLLMADVPPQLKEQEQMYFIT